MLVVVIRNLQGGHQRFDDFIGVGVKQRIKFIIKYHYNRVPEGSSRSFIKRSLYIFVTYEISHWRVASFYFTSSFQFQKNHCNFINSSLSFIQNLSNSWPHKEDAYLKSYDNLEIDLSFIEKIASRILPIMLLTCSNKPLDSINCSNPCKKSTSSSLRKKTFSGWWCRRSIS